MPGLPRQQRKAAASFASAGRPNRSLAASYASQRFQPLRKHRHQRRVARAAAGDDVVDRGALSSSALQTRIASRNGFCRQRRGRCQCVFGRFALHAAPGQKLGRVLAAKLLASGGARRLQLVIGIAQLRSPALASSTLPRAAIAPLRSNGLPNSCCASASITMLPGPVSNAITLLAARAGRNRRQVRDAADVLQHAPALCIGKQNIIKQRNQRRTLSAGGHVGGAEIRNNRHAQRFSAITAASPACHVQANLRPAYIAGACLVIQRLPVASDQIEFDLVPLDRRLHGFGVSDAQPPVQPRQFRRRSSTRHSSPQAPPDAIAAGNGKPSCASSVSFGRDFARRDPHHSHVDSICRRAAHDAGHRHCFAQRVHPPVAAPPPLSR